MRRTIQSNSALYRDLAMESRAVIAWSEKEKVTHIVRKSSTNLIIQIHSRSRKDLKTSLYLHTSTENNFHGGTSCFQFKTISSEEYRELRARVWSHVAPTNPHRSTDTCCFKQGCCFQATHSMTWMKTLSSVFLTLINFINPTQGMVYSLHLTHYRQVCGQRGCRDVRVRRLPQSDCRRGSACRWRSPFSSWSVLQPAAPLWPEGTHRRLIQTFAGKRPNRVTWQQIKVLP